MLKTLSHKNGFSTHPALVSWILGLILIFSAGTICASPLNKEYVPGAAAAVALGASLAYLLTARDQRKINASWACLYVGILTQIVAATAQAFTAVRLPSSFFLPVNDLPGIAVAFITLAGCTAFVVTRFNSWGLKGLLWGGLFGASVFSSTLYLRSFTVVEAGPVYGAIFALTLASLFSAVYREPSRCALSAVLRSPVMKWLGIFLAAYGVSALFSPTKGESLNAWLRLVSVSGLGLLVALALLQQDEGETTLRWRSLPFRFIARLDATQWNARNLWIVVAGGAVIIAGVIPIVLGLVKFISMVWRFDLPSALIYRLHPNEIGGANLLARSVLCVVPLGNMLIQNSGKSPILKKWVGIGWLIAGFALLGYSQSWEGVFALASALGVYFAVIHWQLLVKIWREKFQKSWKRMILAVMTASVLVILVFSLNAIARQINSYSYNGRLFHWQAAVFTWLDHPWVGAGPANELAYTPYVDRLVIPDTGASQYDPDYLLSVQSGYPVKWHSHNLLLEIGNGTGLLGFIPFILFLLAMGKLGLRIARSELSFWKLGGAGCLAGIAGELAWGLMDVLWETPPLFSFPVWCLLGLLMAAEVFSVGGQVVIIENSHLVWYPGWGVSAAVVLLALGLIASPTMASYHYAAGFLAFQEHRWQDAVNRFERAVRYAPLDAHSSELLAKSNLEIGNADGALEAYERANKLKQGYSPYLRQLGWLAWLQGDTVLAADFFEQAIRVDPYETWSDGLHANLGLLQASLGNAETAVTLLKQSIELHPQLAASLYWRPATVSGTNSTDDGLVLDPAYQNVVSGELALRIRNQLGISNITERNFSIMPASAKTILFRDVLDAIEMDYQQAQEQGDRKAMLLLAALAEASTHAGMTNRAENAYRTFQDVYPDNVYGYRGLGVLYRQAGKITAAENALFRAEQKAPADFDTLYQLAQIYLEKGMLEKSEQELGKIVTREKNTLFVTKLFSWELYTMQARIQAESNEAAPYEKSLIRAAYLNGTPSAYIQAAKIYQQHGKTDQAIEFCFQAADVLFASWQNPQSNDLWKIGQCLGQMVEDPTTHPEIIKLIRQYPFQGEILLGHIFRAQAKYDLAMKAYIEAAKVRSDDSGVHYFLGETYQALGQLDQAETEFHLSASLNIMESLPLIALGQMQWDQGNRPEALESYRAVVAATPGWGLAHIKLGNALLAMGNRTEASAHYQLARTVDGDFREGEIFDFVSKFAESNIQAPGENYIRADYLTINDEHKRGLFMHPDSRVVYTVDLRTLESPKELNLNFDLTMLQDSWVLEGDGVTFNIYISESQNEDMAFSEYIDPKHNYKDQKWNTRFIDLSQYAGKDITITFETTCGPSGDCRFDWAGWGNPYIETVQLP